MGFLIAALALGFLGSFHCIGMCGPIALALPVHHRPPVVRQLLIALYTLGRLLSYTCLGVLAGTLGKGFAIAGLQQGLSIGIGLLLLASVWLPKQKAFTGAAWLNWLRNQLSGLFSKGTRRSLLLIGVLNGFLPCGLVYVGLAGAAATGHPLYGGLFMLTFGLGTSPLLFVLPLMGSRISSEWRSRIRKATPVAVSVMAVLLVLRGFNLGIPYVSPKIENNAAVCCSDSQQRPVVHCAKPKRQLQQPPAQK